MTLEEQILRRYRVIAVVGLSGNPERPSYRVAEYLQRAGYTIIPVNPMEDTVLGQTCYPSLGAVPGPVEVVDVFRKSVEVPDIVAGAVKIGAKAVWLQEGVVNEEAAQTARSHGLLVVMDKCMARERQNLRLE